MNEGFMFNFAYDEGEGYFDDDSKAVDNLVTQETEFEQDFDTEEYYDELDRLYNDELDTEDIEDTNVSLINIPALIAISENTNVRTSINRTSQERISLKEFNSTNKEVKRKLPLRPFEQHVQDILDGKKTINDPL